MKRITVFIKDETHKKVQGLQAFALPKAEKSVSFSAALDFVLEESKINEAFKQKFLEYLNDGGRSS